MVIDTTIMEIEIKIKINWRLQAKGEEDLRGGGEPWAREGGACQGVQGGEEDLDADDDDGDDGDDGGDARKGGACQGVQGGQEELDPDYSYLPQRDYHVDHFEQIFCN